MNHKPKTSTLKNKLPTFVACHFIITGIVLALNASDLRQLWSQESAVASTPVTDEDTLRKTLVGSWRIISATFDGKPSELHRTSITIKHITPVHAIWIGYQPEDRRIFRSAGGSWTIEKGQYVETMRYGLDEKFKSSSFGKSLGFDCRFEGDRWIQSGTLPNGIVLQEVWQRVKANEDVAQRPDE